MKLKTIASFNMDQTTNVIEVPVPRLPGNKLPSTSSDFGGSEMLLNKFNPEDIAAIFSLNYCVFKFYFRNTFCM